MKKISKGYFLGKLLKISDSIHAEMRQIFIRNNVPVLDLKLLPDPERKLWQSLYDKSNRVGSMMCKIIIKEKP